MTYNLVCNCILKVSIKYMNVQIRFKCISMNIYIEQYFEIQKIQQSRVYMRANLCVTFGVRMVILVGPGHVA